MDRHLRSVRRFWGTALASQIEYQLNLVIDIAAMAANLAGSVLILSIFYGSDPAVADASLLGGWSWYQALIVQGFYTILDGVATTWLRPNLGAIVTQVREGTLDFVLLKPIDSQFWVSLRMLSPAGLPEIALGLALVGWAASKAGVSFNAGLCIVLLLMLACSLLTLYSLWFMLAATSIWFVKVWNATEVLRAALTAGRFPLQAYPPALRVVFTVVLPVAFMTTVPAQVLLGRADAFWLIAAVVVAVTAFGLSRWIWMTALAHYTSASS